MINLENLRRRSNGGSVTLEAAEAAEIIAELAVARGLAGLPLDGTGWPMPAQQEMIAQLLVNLSADVAGMQEARLVAGVLLQELAGLARTQVRSSRR